MTQRTSPVTLTRICAAIAAIIAIAILFIVLDARGYLATEVSRVLLWLVAAVIPCGLIALVTRVRLIDPDVDPRVVLIEVVLDFVLSVTTGISLFYLIHQLRPDGSAFDFAEGLPGFYLGLLMFLILLVARAAQSAISVRSVVRPLEEGARTIKASAEQLEGAVSRADLLAAAAAAFHVQDRLHMRNANGDALLAGVHVLQGAIQGNPGRDVPHNSESQHLPSTAWWRLMQTYHNEELFDVTARTVVTNVRNFAFSLLATIAACREALKHNERLLVVNASPFNPKDFYNWPDGSPGDRTYHEAEFFAIYRRALAAMFASDKTLIPVRILTTLKEEESNQDVLAKTVPSIGWLVDCTTKMYLDLARHYMLPYPVAGVRAHLHARQQRWSCPQPMEPTDWFRVYGMKLPPDNHAATVRWLLTPFRTYVVGAEKGDRPPRSRAWAERNMYEDSGTRTPRPNVDVSPETFTVWSNDIKETVTQSGIQWSTIERGDFAAIRACYENLFKTATGGIVAEFLSANSKSRRALIPQLVDGAKENLPKCPEHALRSVLSALDEVLIARESLATTRPTGDGSERLCKLINACHEADAYLRLIYLCQGTNVLGDHDVPPASVGGQLGLFEEWLLSWIVLWHGKRMEQEMGSGPVPLWACFAADFLGWRVQDTGDWLKALDSVHAHMIKRMVVHEVTEADEGYRGNDIRPEFLLLASTEEEGDDAGALLHRAKSIALICTEMSQPFLACRVQVAFPAPSLGAETRQGDLVEEHMKFVRTLWEKNGDAKESTASFLDALRDEVTHIHGRGG